MPELERKRCDWVNAADTTYMKYHDEEWGTPLHDDVKLFEFLFLEGAQAGLSWKTILNKRDAFRIAFEGFDPVKVAAFGESEVKRLLSNQGIIRNELKIRAAINNANAFLKVQEQFGSFDAYMWEFVGNKPVINGWKKVGEIPAKTPLSDRISKDLIEKGFKFVGSTICYAHMQATGIVNDHIVDCYRFEELAGES